MSDTKNVAAAREIRAEVVGRTIKKIAYTPELASMTILFEGGGFMVVDGGYSIRENQFAMYGIREALHVRYAHDRSQSFDDRACALVTNGVEIDGGLPDDFFD